MTPTVTSSNSCKADESADRGLDRLILRRVTCPLALELAPIGERSVVGYRLRDELPHAHA